MEDLPPPYGPPASEGRPSPPRIPVDPWAEQRRRRELHRLERRRRRKRRAAIVAAPVVAVAAVAGVLWWAGRSADAPDTDDPAGQADIAVDTVVTSAPTSAAPPSSPAPERLVAVGEAWLLDRDDGTYDWGLTVTVPPDAPARSEIVVTVYLLDESGEELTSVARSLDGVSSAAPTAVAGRITDPDVRPRRLTFDITVGVESSDPALDQLLSTRAVERDGDVLTGRIRSSSAEEITDVAMVMVWRDDDGGAGADTTAGSDEVAGADIVDVVVYDVDRLRPGVDARFEIDLAAQRTPDGVPDDVYWAPTD